MKLPSVLVGVPCCAIVGFGLFGFAKNGDQNTKVAPVAPVVTVPNKVTYAENVAPILDKHCTKCHHDDAVAPFSLVGYDNAKRQSAMVANSASDKRMPPWKAVHGYGDFLDENRLTDTDIAILKKWAETGSNRGDAAKEPKPQVFNPTWELGTPDIVLQASKPFKLEAEGDDVYRNFVFDLHNTEPVYVTAMDVKPGNKQVVHHVIGFLDVRGRSVTLEKNNKDGQEGYTTSGGGIGVPPSGALGGWAPGVTVRKTPAGTAFVVQPGTKIVMQVHYHKDGKEETDQTKLGLYTTKVKPERQMDIYWCAQHFFKIPVGAADQEVTWQDTMPADATIYYVMPHMHLLGKSMKAKVIKDDGTEVPLVFVDHWDFNWQLIYALKEPLKVKKGWKLAVEAHYDNSDDNPYKTDRPVTWGEQTTDEMALLVVGYTAERPITIQQMIQQKLKDGFRRGGQ
ncbi:MAG: ascorbate-dependent monooxygenase [Armatimonadetes bacterium]|nr:ascorbate-dependent monooxygenase [Armatimonadota bacterium]